MKSEMKEKRSYPVQVPEVIGKLIAYKGAAIHRGDTELASEVDKVIAGCKRGEGSDGVCWVPRGLPIKLVRDARVWAGKVQEETLEH